MGGENGIGRLIVDLEGTKGGPSAKGSGACLFGRPSCWGDCSGRRDSTHAASGMSPPVFNTSTSTASKWLERPGCLNPPQISHSESAADCCLVGLKLSKRLAKVRTPKAKGPENGQRKRDEMMMRGSRLT